MIAVNRGRAGGWAVVVGGAEVVQQYSRLHSDVLCCQKLRMCESLDQAGERFEGGYTPERGIVPRPGFVLEEKGRNLDKGG